MIISVDFDGTCVTHEFPRTGKNIGAEIVLKALEDCGHKIICVSMRSSEHTEQLGVNTIQGIKDWFIKNGINLFAINDNPEQNEWSKSRKIYANLYVDDQFLGCPLIYNTNYSKRLFVNWYGVAINLYERGAITKDEVEKILNDLIINYPDLYNNIKK